MAVGGFIAAAALWPAVPAHAQVPGDDPALLETYTVSGVSVRAEGATVVEAKDRALAQGQSQALRRLLQRLTLSEDHARLPQPEAREVEAMVLGLSIDNERTPPRGYIADLTVSFMPEAVQDLLQQAGIPFADRRAPVLVVVPVWQDGADARPLLWQDPNPWRRAWAERRPGGLVPLEAPLGDVEDVMSLDVDQVLIGDEDALERFASRYRAAGALLTTARLDGAQVRVDARSVGARVEPMSFTSIQPLPAGLPPAEGLAQALAEAVAAVSRQMDEAWKMRAVGFSTATGQLTALLTLSDGLNEWADVQRRLGRTMAVRESQVQAMTRDRVQLLLTFAGTEEELAAELARQGIVLRDGGGYWALERVDAAGWR